MRYVKARFKNVTPEVSDMLIAMLSEIGYDGFEEGENELLAYTGEEAFKAAELDAVAGALGVSFETEAIAQQNWNATWEQSFEPILVADKCIIRAPFHSQKNEL